jgi:hypothetical protein
MNRRPSPLASAAMWMAVGERDCACSTVIRVTKP